MTRGAVLVAAAVFAGSCAVALETVYVPAERAGWKFGYGVNKPGYTIAEFVPEGETVSNWSRILSIQFFEGAPQSPQQVMNEARARMETRCPAQTEWQVFAYDPRSITYAWSISNCPGQEDESEVARLLKGNDGLHRVAYARKGKFAPGERTRWLNTFSEAYVQKNGKRVVVAP